MSANNSTDDTSTVNEENRIANLDLRPQNEFDALQLYEDALVINHLDGRRVEEIVDWEIVEVSVVGKSWSVDWESETDLINRAELLLDKTTAEGWVSDQLDYQCGDYTDMWAVGTRKICIEDAEGIVYTVKFETDR